MVMHDKLPQTITLMACVFLFCSEIPSSKVKTIADMCVTLDIWYNAKVPIQFIRSFFFFFH